VRKARPWPWPALAGALREAGDNGDATSRSSCKRRARGRIVPALGTAADGVQGVRSVRARGYARWNAQASGRHAWIVARCCARGRARFRWPGHSPASLIQAFCTILFTVIGPFSWRDHPIEHIPACQIYWMVIWFVLADPGTSTVPKRLLVGSATSSRYGRVARSRESCCRTPRTIRLVRLGWYAGDAEVPSRSRACIPPRLAPEWRG